ncbi:MAG: hypothetical protein Fur0020_12150 [Thermodesulfovibrionia bacterium]
MRGDGVTKRIIWLIVFGIAMGYLESAVVVYLRAIYYPDGFGFPLRPITDYKIVVEVFREVSTIFMLLAVAMLGGRNGWERFAHFILSFGVWDIVYYIGLKITINWPLSIFDWDILFLIPIPWIGPVIAPVSVSILFIIGGILISYLINKGYEFKATIHSYILALIGSAIILYSFMHDIGATLYQQPPKPYHYEFLITGESLFVVAFIHSLRRTIITKA